MENEVEMDCGSRGWGGMEKGKGGKSVNCNRINKNLKKEKNIYLNGIFF